jgi:hypothetical protein
MCPWLCERLWGESHLCLLRDLMRVSDKWKCKLEKLFVRVGI